MLKNMRNLCRVCSGPGQHEINAPIPFYLHEMDNNEALEWPQPIWMLLQDILNVPVLPNDGLPQKMCTICISYMKHAITFRKQALACRLGLLRASHVYFKEETKEGLCDTERIPQTPVCLEDRNDNLKTVNATVNKLQTKAKLPDTTKKVIQTCSNARSYFSYRQKPFVEDDITTMSIFDGENFAANPPEKLSQRDCSFCW
ncbi:uncharacterized protein LOC129809367, partial [Phlebotomus papatasi]|uniref:uncharacterized protein LOC129809367 n=1 Tax=Phlebotomus papatasi TaxID=29031 RepID=UPI00248339E7